MYDQLVDWLQLIIDVNIVHVSRMTGLKEYDLNHIFKFFKYSKFDYVH